jgi:hypothetical protein
MSVYECFDTSEAAGDAIIIILAGRADWCLPHTYLPWVIVCMQSLM